MRRIGFALLLVLAAGPVLAQDLAYAPPIVLESRTESATIAVTLSRAAEAEPALFRRLVEDARRYVTTFKANAAVYHEEFGDRESWRPYDLTLRYEDRFVNARLISVLATSREYSGGARGNTYFSTVLFDRTAGEVVALADLFSETSADSELMTALDAVVRADLAAQKAANDPGAFDPLDDPALSTFRATPQVMNVFSPVPSTVPGKVGGLTFHIAPYLAGSYAEGAYHVTVPQSVFHGFLADGFRDLFAGEPRVGARLDVAGEPASVVVVDGIGENDVIAPGAVIAGEAPAHWFAAGPATARLVAPRGEVLAEAPLTPADDRPGEAGFAMRRFSGSLTFAGGSASAARLVLISSDVRPLERDGETRRGPAEAGLAVRLAPTEAQ